MECTSVRWRTPVHGGGLMSLKWHGCIHNCQLTVICQRASDHDRRKVHGLL